VLQPARLREIARSRPQIEKLLNEDRSVKSVSEETGIPYQTVLRWCQHRGVDTSGAQKTARLQKRAKELAKQRMGIEEIAKQLDVGARTVSRWLASAEVSTHGQKGAPPIKKQKYLTRVLELHGQGKNVYEIADEIGDVHYATVITWLRDAEQKPNYGRVSIERQARKVMDIQDDPRRTEAIARYLTGEAATTIDKALKVAQGTTELWARHDGVWEQGGKFKRRRDRGELARTLHGQGETQVAIANALGTDFYTAKKIMIEEGLLDESQAGPGLICPCGTQTPSPNQRYCDEHRDLYGKKRQPNPDNHVMIVCLYEECPRKGEPLSRYKGYGNGALLFCSNDCARKHTKTRKFYAVEDFDIVFESAWEAYVWAKLTFVKIPVDRFEREQGVPWREDGWYAPDLWLPNSLAIEVKGQPDEEDREKWTKYRAERGPLVVLGPEQMRHFHEISEKAELIGWLATTAVYQGEGEQFSEQEAV
jgi:transposase